MTKRKATEGESRHLSAKHVHTKTKLKNTERQRRTAWRMYYDEMRDHYKTLRVLDELRKDRQVVPVIPKHIGDKIRELITKYDEGGRECSICLQDITFETSLLTDCGHLFHAACMATLTECPLCRGKYAPKKKTDEVE